MSTDVTGIQTNHQAASLTLVRYTIFMQGSKTKKLGLDNMTLNLTESFLFSKESR